MSKIDLLKEQISQKEKYIDQMRQEHQQRVVQLKAKYEAEIGGIESKIGTIVAQRRTVLEQKEAALREAAKVHESARVEASKALQSLSEAQKLIPVTKKKQENTYKTAEKSLQKQIAQIVKTAQNEIKALKKQIPADEKAK